ncbi:MAG: TetR/AcrR family transcriptional regulator, partial [Clostridia bacterium]|nr:TetR/AcrR family transcriptional regulator [Clostridia bacterium]
REQFLKYGYEKASLRQICAGAGVSTGALYNTFKNKEALFDALVRPTVAELDRILTLDAPNNEALLYDELFELLLEHRDGARLLVTRADGSRYEGFRRKIRTLLKTVMIRSAETAGQAGPDPEVADILSAMYFTGLSELISRDTDPARMQATAAALRTCMESGLRTLSEPSNI